MWYYTSYYVNENTDQPQGNQSDSSPGIEFLVVLLINK